MTPRPIVSGMTEDDRREEQAASTVSGKLVVFGMLGLAVALFVVGCLIGSWGPPRYE